MPIFNDHPYTSITIKIDQLSKPHQNDEIDNTLELYVSDLLHLIKIQPSTGASEAARAIRKRIKYGDSVEELIRALNILELLILNSGSKIGPVIARDDKLLDVLKGVINGSGKTGVGLSYDPEVRKRASQLAVGWKSELQDLDGYKYMASLWKYIPRAKKSTHGGSHSRSHSRSQSGNFSNDPEEVFSGSDVIRSPSPSSPAMQNTRDHRKDLAPPRPTSPKPTSSSGFKNSRTKPSKDKSKKSRRKKTRNGIVYADEQYKIPQINYKVEAPKIRNTIAECHTHTTTLGNLLISLPSSISLLDDAKVSHEFNKCKSIRRKVLKYLQFVGAGDPEEKKPEVLKMDEEFLGSLIVANEQLVEVFKKYDFLAGYTDENPAPNYSEESSEESYYTDESSDEESRDPQVYDDEADLVADHVGSMRLNEGSSSSANTGTVPTAASKSPPPPRPSKPANLLSPHKTLQRTDTNATTGTASSDPFGDGNELSNAKSVYD